MINCRIFILNSNRVQSLWTEQEQSKLTKGEVSCYSHTLQEPELQDLSSNLKSHRKHSNKPNYTVLHTFEHSNTL